MLIEKQYQGWDQKDAVNDYIARMNAKIPHFETMEERELNYIKVGAYANFENVWPLMLNDLR